MAASDKPRQNPKPRRYPSEDRTDTRPKKSLGGMSMSEALGATQDPAMLPAELADIERIVDSATPEQFQAELARVLRKMMARGLREIPPPRSIKELQALYDMFRKAEGIERADKAGGPISSGFLPRVVGRRNLGVTKDVTTVEFPAERVETVEAEPGAGIPVTDDEEYEV